MFIRLSIWISARTTYEPYNLGWYVSVLILYVYFILILGMYYIHYINFLIVFFLRTVHILPYLCYMIFDMFYILWAMAPCRWIEWIKKKYNTIWQLLSCLSFSMVLEDTWQISIRQQLLHSKPFPIPQSPTIFPIPQSPTIFPIPQSHTTFPLKLNSQNCKCHKIKSQKREVKMS